MTLPGVARLYQRVVSEGCAIGLHIYIAYANQNSPRSKQIETGGEMYVVHSHTARSFCRWITMMMMNVLRLTVG